jgi:hypothetical protein
LKLFVISFSFNSIITSFSILSIIILIWFKTIWAAYDDLKSGVAPSYSYSNYSTSLVYLMLFILESKKEQKLPSEYLDSIDLKTPIRTSY